MNEIIHLRADELSFDTENPRMVEFNITSTTSEEKILSLLWDNMAVDEIVMSILAHGFFPMEAIYVVVENGKNVVVEGNRRLAAVKSILHPDKVSGRRTEKFLPNITASKISELEKGLPVIMLENREAAWRYIGFKHVNGAAKWGSYAKAQYIYLVHTDYGKSLEEIAEQIGDTNYTVKKLYQGLMVIKEAERRIGFQTEDTYSERIYFSHLYTALGYEGFKRYLDIQLEDDGNINIPKEQTEHLKDVMIWLYGSRSNDVKPIVRTQNPDLRRLDAVLGSKEATYALHSDASLDEAYEIAQGGAHVLMEALIKAKLAVQKALANSSSYEGDEENLKIAGTIANTADTLYKTFKAKYFDKKIEGTERISE